MNNNIIQLSRCALIILLSGLTVLATAQVKTSKKTVSVETNTSEPVSTTSTANFQGPIGIVPTYEFVIEDDIMQSKDGENEDSNPKNEDEDKSDVVSTYTSDVKNTNFTTSSLNQLAQGIKIYPIPANTFTNIYLGEVKIAGIEVINNLGQKVYSQAIDQQFLRLDTSNYQTGIYFIQMRTAGNQVITKTIMVN